MSTTVLSLIPTELKFEKQGFARFELQIWDPDQPDLSDEAQAQVEAILGCPMKQVWARV